MKTTIALAIFTASITAAVAKVDKACVRDARETFGAAQAKRVCDTKYDAKPHEWGWVCDGGGGTPYRVKGAGARLKRHVICE